MLFYRPVELAGAVEWCWERWLVYLDQVLEDRLEVFELAVVEGVDANGALSGVSVLAGQKSGMARTGNFHFVSHRALMDSWCLARLVKSSPSIQSPSGASFMMRWCGFLEMREFCDCVWLSHLDRRRIYD